MERDIESKIRSLPKWAQLHIGKLKNERDTWRDMAKGERDGPVVIGSSAHLDIKVAYSKHVRVQFNLPNGEHVTAHLGDETLVLMASTMIAAIGQSGNTFRIRADRDLY